MSILLLMWLGFQEAQVQEEVRVRFVLLDVAAYDKEGMPVMDLTADDFVVEDDRKKVDVTYFSTEDRRRPFDYETMIIPAKDGAIPENPLSVTLPKLVLVLDFQPLRDEEALAAFDQLESFLKQLGPKYRYLIRVYALDKRFIGDRWEDRPQKILERLEEYKDWFFRVREEGHNWVSDRMSNVPERDSGWVTREAPETYAGPLENLGQLVDAVRRCISRRDPRITRYITNPCQCAGLVSYYIQKQKERSALIVKDLELLAGQMGDDSELKSMFILTPGFLVKDVYGLPELRMYFLQAGCRNLGAEARNPTRNFRGPSPIIEPEKFYLLGSDFNRVYSMCARNRITYHTFDIGDSQPLERRMGREIGGGVRGSFGRIQKTYNQEQVRAMIDMAEETGGSFVPFDQLGTMDQAMTRILEDYRFVYVLGYNAPQGKPDKYRKVKVKVKRKGLTLRYRRGYTYRW
ncbi:MAG: VWA domain-containing protein [Acidobacteriota bacterium]|nr:VWA domain-containing protein [Acidobacteriota bacterium]